MVCSLLAGQPPAETPKANGQKVEGRIEAEEGGRLDVIFAAAKPDDLQTALTNHPDVQIAEAKLRVAQAELAKVKLLVAQLVTATKAKVSAARAEVARVEQEVARVKKLRDSKVVSGDEVQHVAARLEQAKAVLAAAEADLRAALGTPPAGSSVTFVDAGFNLIQPREAVTISSGNIVLTGAAPTGSVADKLRSVLDRPIAMKAALEKVRPEAALDALKKAAEIDFLIKWGPGDLTSQPLVVSLPAGERTLAAWFDLLADEFELEAGRRPPVRLTPYVREYGLLIAAADSRPPGAVSLAEFAKQATVRPAPGVAEDVLARLRKALAKTVNRADMTVPPALFFKELFAATGPELVVQSPLFTPEPIAIPGGEKTVAAWLDQFQDRWNTGRRVTDRYEYFVRDYGLLLCLASEAPPGAVPLSQIK